MIVAFTQGAEAELEAIADFIARDNPARALSFVQELVAKCTELALMPEAFPLVPRHEGQGIRRRVHGRYLIFYRLAPGQVTILHILNGAMDIDALLFPEG